MLTRNTQPGDVGVLRTFVKLAFEDKMETSEVPSTKGPLGVYTTARARRSRVSRNPHHGSNRHPLSVHHLRHNADMNLGDSFSKLKKKVEYQLAGTERKWGGKETDADGEIVGRASSLPQLAPHVVAGDGEGSGANTDGRQVCSTNLLPQQDEPEPVQVDGNKNNQGEEGMDVDGRESSQCHSHPHPDVGVVMGSGSGRGDDAGGEECSGKTIGA